MFWVWFFEMHWFGWYCITGVLVLAYGWNLTRFVTSSQNYEIRFRDRNKDAKDTNKQPAAMEKKQNRISTQSR